MKKLLKIRMIVMLTILLTGSFTIFTSCNKTEETFDDQNTRNLDLALDQSGNNNFGLGLALVKKICDYHKIKIDVISEIKKGTTFTLSFKNLKKTPS